MARTYHAEGRQLAKLLKALFISGGVILYISIPGLHWGFFIAIVIAAILLSEIAGAMWTQKRRMQKKSKKASKVKQSK
ncbi:hypothetical protein [Paenibacillus sp. FSL W7-1287]|uniref:hypothetical protein n=1 Tax=Paenibacillus sp. FSL W7-1287 TaxID=2954538 RepID=UPI0030F86977